MHIRFSASDVYFVQSIACSSMTFALIYTATRESSRGLRILATLALPGLAYTTILVRPLNVGFFPLFVFTAIWLVGRRAPLVRKLVIVGLLSVAAGAAFWQFMGGPGGGITEELFVGMFENSGAALFDLKFNTLLNPVITPTGFLLLATAGAVIPFVHKEGRLRALFLLVWLVAFFVTHAIIMPRQPEMQARYHLHLAVPFALLVAWGARRFLARGRIAGALLALYALAIPFVHLGFETDVAFDQMREYDFLATLPEQLPRDCTVIEFTGSMIATESSRTRRHAEAVHKGERTRLYKTYEVGRLGERVDYDDLFGPLGKASPAAVNRGAEMASITRADIQRLFDEETPECIYLYEGLRCWSEKAPTEAQAPSCDVLRDMLVLEKVAEERFPPRIYDSNFALGYGEDLDNPPFDELGVALYKVRRIREPLSTPRRTDERSPETTPEAL